MGVTTRADEHLNKASEHVQAAIENLSEIVVARCWGHDDFTKIAEKNIIKAHQKALELRHLLENLSEEED